MLCGTLASIFSYLRRRWLRSTKMSIRQRLTKWAILIKMTTITKEN